MRLLRDCIGQLHQSRAARFCMQAVQGLRRTAVLNRVVGIAAACILSVAVASRLHFVVAVSMEGDFLCYVSSREELDSVIASVEETASSALGYDYTVPELDCHVTLGTPEPDSLSRVANEIYGAIDELRDLQLVYVDGEAVCAYETRTEAVEAVEALRREYWNDTTQSIAFAQELTIAGSYASVSLLENSDAALREAVDVITTEPMQVRSAIAYGTRYIEDATMFLEEELVESPGVEGLEVTDYLVTRENGKLTQYQKLMVSTRSPEDEVVRVGTRVHRSRGSYEWPVASGLLTSHFGYRNIGIGSTYHAGIDIGAASGDPIFAADGGLVIFADENAGYGLIVKIQHDNGDVTYYAHCESLLVEEGDAVDQGEMIATMGATGVATGVHLHFEIRPNGGSAVNPLDHLPESGIRMS